MAIDLTTKFLPYVDEMFTAESKKELLTNKDFSWSGAHTVKVYKVTTTGMNDYDRTGANTANWSRYGEVMGLDATTDEYTLKKDRSFTFAIDKLDADETLQQLSSASALARQQREVIIPEVDTYVYGVMAAGAGIKPAATTLTADNIYMEVIKANNALDNAGAPETGRNLVITPDVYLLMKQCKDIVMDTNISNEMRLNGVISILDGLRVIKVPAARLPKDFGFMVAHPVATVAPVKLEDYTVHQNPPGINGDLVEGRIAYDAFVLENKKNAIYYQAVTTTGA